MTTNSKKQAMYDYKSALPNFLLTFVDSIIKIDHSQILRFDFLNYTVDELLRSQGPRQESICIFFDPLQLNHIFLENIKRHPSDFPFLGAKSFVRETWEGIVSTSMSKIFFSGHPFLLKHMRQSQLYKWEKLQIVSIDQVRQKCQANVYVDPEQVILDIWGVIAWNQIFRAKSANSFIYLNLLIESITQIINIKRFHKKFTTYKSKDFQKLVGCQLQFKIQCEKWPYVPTKFREYQQIDRYVSTPQNRNSYIEKRVATKKVPVECPQDCVCFSDLSQPNKQFCRYSLKDGWLSECPNRKNKIQCSHQDEQKMSRCRNAQIKKKQKKKCKKNQIDDDPQNQIQECLMWGLDLYTRNIIFNSLPETEYLLNQKIDNRQYKNEFIQVALLKAINFNGVNGYDLRKACQLIINSFQSGQDNEKNNQTFLQKQNGTYQLRWNFSILLEQAHNQQQNKPSIDLFNKRDKYYAQILLKNYEYCQQNIKKDSFRIHTKGKGARCIKKQGIRQGSFIVEYFGQLYEPWRWYQRQDFIKDIMKNKKLKNYIPQFYNIYLEHHKDDPEGYDLMVVDPNKKGNFSSRFSHSCSPNCGTVTTISDGKYYIGMYSFRDIKYGEELTFDYCCMTQSNYQHLHSICLCGTQKCRGNYLQLANSRTFSQLIDKNTCFLSRNSLILQAIEPFNEQDLKRCGEHNIKNRMLDDCPQWIKKWTGILLKFIETQVQFYKRELVQRWKKQYPWEPAAQQVQQKNIQLYSQTAKNDLFTLRFQNLFTTVDKMKYYLNTIGSNQPPLYFLTQEEVYNYMVSDKSSILNQVLQVLISKERVNQASLIKKFFEFMSKAQDIKIKLMYFRLCCLCISQLCMNIKPTQQFNSYLLGDILYFYAFTHTYFTANEYKSHVSEEIVISLMEITGKPSDSKSADKLKRKYSSQFIWGQVVSWYKQTIANPEASLSQDRRGTLSYPMIKSITNSKYPFDKHCRSGFLRALREKSANSWPCAPQKGCILSFKNPFKCYGTVFFQSIHNSAKFKDLPTGNLLSSVLDKIDSQFHEKVQFFKKVEEALESTGQLDERYNILDFISAKFNVAEKVVLISENEQSQEVKGATTKKRKK